MAKSTSETDAIEALLQQRAQYEQWLGRLDSAGDKAPPAVRAKVRGDYEGRLRGVIDELRGHAATIAAELDRHKATQNGLDLERRQAEEALAEAEVRHAVGEYSEGDWRKLSDQSNEQLTRLRSELRLVGEEIARLAEVQGLIGGAPVRAEPPAPAPAPAPAPPPPPVAVAPEPEPEPVAPLPPPAPAPAERPAAKAAPVRDLEITHGPPPVDELAFLKSVAPPEERKAPPAPAPAPPRRASNPGGPTGGRTSESPVAASQTAAPGKGGTAGVAKTLKCGECGTLNRPTEWYCERCGAELAGI
jgi:outer membrane biosynthesis protein TonB